MVIIPVLDSYLAKKLGFPQSSLKWNTFKKPKSQTSCLLLAAAIGGNAIVGEAVEEVSNSKVTTQEVADILGIHISDLRRMMRQGKIAAPPILFDPKTNSTGRMWSEDDIEAVRTALKTASADS